MALQVQQLMYLLLLVAGCLYGAIRGGAPERWGAGLLLLGVVLTNVAAAEAHRRYGWTSGGVLAADIALAVALIALALKADRYWPMWAAAVQLDAVLTHILMFSAETAPFSYAFGLWLFSLPLPVLIGVGAWRHRQRLRRYGDDPDWSPAY